MLSPQREDEIIDLINREVIPAIGCTEPIAVALCTAKATELLGTTPKKIKATLSANIIKNAMGVGIPGTGMIGLPIAIALGALKGKSMYELEVLKDVDEESISEGKKMITENRIAIGQKKGIDEKLYIEIECEGEGERKSKAIISGSHTRFVYLHDGEKTIEDLRGEQSGDETEHVCNLDFDTIYKFATETDLDKLRFILDSAHLNTGAWHESMNGDYGHQLGEVIRKGLGKQIIGESIFADIVASTAGACDARMGGAMVTVMSNSGSGNQGITATMPVVRYATLTGKSEEELIRALILSHLTVIYIKQSLGRLSALCGCVVAGTGSSCGITYLMGGNYNQLTYAVKNMIANLTGMICDGAKPSCALKVTSGISTAIYSALMAMEDKTVSSLEGIIDDDVDRTIANFSRIGVTAMANADEEILRIMLEK